MLVQRDKSRSDLEHLDREVGIASQETNAQQRLVPSQQGPQQPTPQSYDDVREENSDVESRDLSGEESIDGLATVSNIDHRGSRYFGSYEIIAVVYV